MCVVTASFWHANGTVGPATDALRDTGLFVPKPYSRVTSQRHSARDLGCAVRGCPLVSAAASRDGYSLGYSVMACRNRGLSLSLSLRGT
jgi:hypothetical protein